LPGLQKRNSAGANLGTSRPPGCRRAEIARVSLFGESNVKLMAVALIKIVNGSPAISDTLPNQEMVRCPNCEQTYRLPIEA